MARPWRDHDGRTHLLRSRGLPDEPPDEADPVICTCDTCGRDHEHGGECPPEPERFGDAWLVDEGRQIVIGDDDAGAVVFVFRRHGQPVILTSAPPEHVPVAGTVEAVAEAVKRMVSRG